MLLRNQHQYSTRCKPSDLLLLCTTNTSIGYCYSLFFFKILFYILLYISHICLKDALLYFQIILRLHSMCKICVCVLSLVSACTYSSNSVHDIRILDCWECFDQLDTVYLTFINMALMQYVNAGHKTRKLFLLAHSSLTIWLFNEIITPWERGIGWQLLLCNICNMA